MRIALLGTRGVPANYGGFETFAEELSVRLAERGHEVTVYCRERSSSPTYRGVKLAYMPTIRHKYFDTITHTCLSTVAALPRRFDVLLYCNAANAVFTWLPRVLGSPTALNVDGLERHRKKWNQLAKNWYLLSEWLSTWCCSRVVTDAARIQEYYFDRYGKSSLFIPYGAEVGKEEDIDALKTLGLEPENYFLYVSRLEPENNALMVREAFEKVKTGIKLALVGSAPYAADYIRRVRATSDPRVIIPGAIYGAGYRQLQSRCFAYIHATEVGGTHPALIEAMGRGAMVLYLRNPENEEVAGGAGIPFEPDTLAEKLQWAVEVSEAERLHWGFLAQKRVQERYSWDAVTDMYERLFAEMAGKAPAETTAQKIPLNR
jgi:glycosyltransferase involved in cell wall biosynthesis